jgi:hypothetical protein
MIHHNLILLFKIQQQVKYAIGTAIIFGPHTLHSTAVVRYAKTNHVCLALSISYIAKSNVNAFLEDFSVCNYQGVFLHYYFGGPIYLIGKL